MSKISFNRFALENQKLQKAKHQNNDAKVAEQTLDVKSIYNNGTLSQQVGLSFQGSFLSSFTAIKDHKGQIISKNDPRYAVLKDIKYGKYLEQGLNKSSIPEITRFLEQDKVEEFKLLLNNNEKYQTGSIRFELKEIEEVLNSLNNPNRKHFKTLIEAKCTNGKSYRIMTDDICKVLRAINEQNTKFVEKIINKKSPSNAEDCFFSSEIAFALQSINEFSANHFDRIIGLKDSNCKPKFEKDEIINVINNINPDNVEQLYKLAKIDKFDGSEISDCLEHIKKDSSDVVNYVIQNSDCTAISRNLARVFECANNENLDQLKTLHTSYKEGNLTDISFNCYLRLAQTDTLDQLGALQDLIKSKRIKFHELNKILNGSVNYIGEQSAVLDSVNARYLVPLLKAKTEDNQNYRFEVQDINTILKSTNKRNRGTLNYLLNARNIDNNNYRFSGFYIRQLQQNSIDINLEELKTLSNLRNPENTGYLLNNDEITDYARLVKAGLPASKIIKGATLDDLTEVEQRNLLKYYRNNSNYIPITFALNTHLPLIKIESKNIEKLNNQIIAKLTEATRARIFNESTVIDNKALNQAIEKIQQSITKSELNENTILELSYSRESFVKDANNALSGLNASDRKLALEYFDFELNEDKFTGFPFIRNNEKKKLSELKNKSNNPEQLERAILKLENVVTNFTKNNSISLPDNKELEKDLNEFTKAFPEWLTTVNKKQHEFHKYTLDIHILRTLKNCVINPDFQKLSPEDKKIATIFIMLHDITKAEEAKDPHHPEDSAKIAYQMLKRTDLSDREVERITGLINNHEWVGLIEFNKENKELLNDYAFGFRKAGDFEITKIFSKADLEAIGNKEFYEANKNNYLKYSNKIEEQIKSFNETGIYVPQTRIPKASEISCNNGSAKRVNINGETNNTVLYLKDANNLEALGFDKGTTRNNFRAISHFINDKNLNITRDIDYASLEGNNGIFSTSYINPKNSVPFFQCNSGLIFDVEPENIGLAHCNNIGSGREKDFETFKSYFTDNTIKENYAREFFSNKAKSIMNKYKNLSSQEYRDIFRQLADKKAITDIKNPEIKDFVEETISHTLLSNIHHNELVVYAPKPKAVISKEKPENIPLHLRKYAEQHDLPVIII